MQAFLDDFVPVLAALLAGVVIVGAAIHAVLYKRDLRAAAGWTAIIIAVPVIGAGLYWLLGINRVQRKASALYRTHKRIYRPPAERRAGLEVLGPATNLARLARLMDRLTVFPLAAGNKVRALRNGDAAYPEMLDAIEGATSTIALNTYIFDRDGIGMRFVLALGRAVARGVEVRVLVDAVGARYSFPTIMRPLRLNGVRAARFNRTLLPWRWTYANLRSHRKLLIVDGQRAFTGGLNIRDGHLVDTRPRRPVVDLHFVVEGPVVEQMAVAFAEDWLFVTRERLDGPGWFPVLPPCGGTFARAILDGPDDDLDKLRWTVLGALACAKRDVVIVTPYFLPEADLLAALSLAVLRGVRVTVFIPENNNQWLVKWACDALLPQVLEWGVRVFRIGGPFDHTKVMVVDGTWVLFGSANLDPRSLRLNFELCVEAYSEELARDIDDLIADKRGRSTEVTLAAHEARSIFARLRDGFARLFVPYL